MNRPEFPTTRWSLVDAAARDRDGEQALTELLHQYLPALQVHLRRRHRLSDGDAEDLLQSFVLDKVMRQQVLERARQGRGRFRTFLLTVLDNYVRNHLRRRGQQLASLSEAAAPVEDGQQAGAGAFEAAWGREVVRQALESMRTDWAAAGRQREWRLFERRLVQPALEQAPVPGYDELVEELGFETPSQAYNALITAKRAFQRYLREVIATYAGDAAEVEAELAELWQAVSRPRA